MPEQAKDQDDVGEISFKVTDLPKLKERLPESQPEGFNSFSKQKSFLAKRELYMPLLKPFSAPSSILLNDPNGWKEFKI
jgi:hypothetical protein